MLGRGLRVPSRQVCRERCCAANRGRILLGADTRHVRGWYRRIAPPTLAAFALACLTGCGGGPGGPRSCRRSSAGRRACSAARRPSPSPPIIGATPRSLSGEGCIGRRRQRSRAPSSGGQQGATTRCAATDRHQRGQGRQDHLYLGRQRRARAQRVARVTGEEVWPSARGRSRGASRQRRDPQHRRQDHIATCGKCRTAAVRPAQLPPHGCGPTQRLRPPPPPRRRGRPRPGGVLVAARGGRPR